MVDQIDNKLRSPPKENVRIGSEGFMGGRTIIELTKASLEACNRLSTATAVSTVISTIGVAVTTLSATHTAVTFVTGAVAAVVFRRIGI